MSKVQNEFKPKFKLLHSFILSCLLTTLLIINSNHMKKIQNQNKLNEEKNKLFNNIIYKRYLEGEEEETSNSGTKTVCDRGSDELKNYYKTGNLKDIKLDEGEIKCEDKDQDYMKALINLLKTYGGGGLEMRNLNGEEEEGSSSEGDNGELMDNLMAYGKHIIPILAFIVVAILCIPGWIICCFCCCCNCCCCCCCKKPGCKIPCFIISYAMYALVVVVCIYGFSQSSPIFIGLADTECSILKFFDEVIVGESKSELPKWAGINGINTILEDLKGELGNMGPSTMTSLNNAFNNINSEEASNLGTKQTFLNKLEEFSNEFYSHGLYNSDYCKNYDSKNYVFDLVQKLGEYDSSNIKGIPEDSYINFWIKEYQTVSSVADEKMESAIEGFNTIINEKTTVVNQALDNGINTINDLNSAFVDIKSGVADIIVEYSGIIDEYGKLVVKAIFGILALIDIGIAVLIFLLCFCSGKACVNCCCCRCLCKMFTHILWNVLALLMIIVFLVGSLIALIGKIGGDSMSLFAYIVSEDNLGEDKETLLLGSVKDYLTICINRDGNIEQKFDFQESLNSFNDIKDAENSIINAKNEFDNLQMVTYNNITGELEKRENLETNYLSLIKDDGSEKLVLGVILKGINDNPKSRAAQETWDISCDSANTCDTGDESWTHTNSLCLHPKKCNPIKRDFIENILPSTTDPSDKDLVDKAKIIDDMIDLVNMAISDDDSSFKTILDYVGEKYSDFLISYSTALGTFQGVIHSITGELNKYTGKDGGMFSFINCKFIGTNMKIILKNLKESLGNDFYTVGVCLILVGCSLILAISSTILLIIIINIDVAKKQELEKNKGFPVNNEGRVIAYNSN